MALVFKCASDTIFLDDFKSVLDAIVSNTLSRAGGLVHRGKKSGHQQPQQQGTSPQAFSSESAGYGPMVTIRSDHPQRSSRKKWEARIFRRRDEENGLKDMSIQRETTITLSDMPTKRNSDGSFGSGNRILPKPMPTATRQQQSEQSHG